MSTQFHHRFEPGEPGKPTLLLLHGTGGDESDLLPLGRSLYPGAALLSVRGQVLENGMPRFFRRLAEGVFDLQDLALRTQELADYLPVAAAQYDLDAENFVAVGYSNGANIAASILLARPAALRGAVLLRAMVPFVPEDALDLSGKPVLLLAGKQDRLVSPANVQALAELLRERGAAVELVFQEAGHNLANEELQAAARWLREKL